MGSVYGGNREEWRVEVWWGGVGSGGGGGGEEWEVEVVVGRVESNWTKSFHW